MTKARNYCLLMWLMVVKPTLNDDIMAIRVNIMALHGDEMALQHCVVSFICFLTDFLFANWE